MRALLLSAALGVSAAVALAPSSSVACTWGDLPPTIVAPYDGAQDVPLNARILLGDVHLSSQDAGVALVRLEDDGGVTEVPVSAELLTWRRSETYTIRLTPQAAFDPGAAYEVRVREDGQTISGFHTGTAADTVAPSAPSGVAFSEGKLLPDAGGGCGGPGGPVFEILGVFPDAGEDLQYFARSGDAGVFSAISGPEWTGYAACSNAAPPELSFNLNSGAAQLEVWTEDLAGNASPVVTVNTNVDCSHVAELLADAGSPDAGSPDAGVTGGGDEAPPALGCSVAGSSGLAGLALLLVGLRTRTRRRRAG